MPFVSPSWVSPLPFNPPDDVPLLDFVFEEQYGRAPIKESLPPFVCALSGASRTLSELKERVEHAAQGLSRATGWRPNSGSEWSKVACVYSPNTIDYVTAAWATLRVGGICAPLSAASTLPEVVSNLNRSGASCIFTCATHVEAALEAAKVCGISASHVFLLELPEPCTKETVAFTGLMSLDQLVSLGKGAQTPLERLVFAKGQGARQTAFLCSSSGTSGMPKGVMISHKNVITSVLQTCTFETANRAWFACRQNMGTYKETALALLPFNHAYGLVVIATVSVYRGDTAVVLPKYELRSLLTAVQEYRITTLYAVPPLVINLKNNKAICDQYNLESVDSLVTAAAPLGHETAAEVRALWPRWAFRQLYGLTESTALVTSSSVHDSMLGSAGSLLPGTEARLLASDGSEITCCDQPGELVVRSPAVVLGYLDREEANAETFKNGWLHTGDEALFRRNHNGNQHLWITDRLKEMIKVKGLQVAPAELEAHLLTHPAVADCAVIPIPHDYAGEVPKAFVVRAAGHMTGADCEKQLVESIKDHVKSCKARWKWLDGGVEFIDSIPKLPSGKILRRQLKERQKAKSATAEVIIQKPVDRQAWPDVVRTVPYLVGMTVAAWYCRLLVRTEPRIL